MTGGRCRTHAPAFARGRSAYRGRWVSLLLCTVVVACDRQVPSAAGILDAPLAEGGSVNTKIRATRSAVLLVYDPEACFTCDGVLARWSSYSRTAGEPLYLVLTQHPLEAQRLQLMAYRVEILGVLRHTPETARAEAYLLRGDGGLEVANSALGISDQTTLLDSLAADAGQLTPTPVR